MPRYGDLDALFNERPEYLNPQHETNGEYNRGWNVCNEYYFKLIINAPTADVAPVVHAHFNDGECTNCGWFGDCVETPYYRYCPNCGAKMDGERKE